MQQQGTMFYVPHSISTKHLQDINTSIRRNCVWKLTKVKVNPFRLHMGLARQCVRKIDMIMSMGIPFQSRKQVRLLFARTKYFITFQVGDFGHQGCARVVFLNRIYKLNKITRHGHSSQKEFTFVGSLNRVTTFLEYII